MPETNKSETAGGAAGIRRLTISEIKQPITKDAPIARYSCPKKPQMPTEEATRAILPLKVLAQQVTQLSRAQFLDFKFFKAVVTGTNTQEFRGFNTKLAREQEQSAQPATRTIYTLLIDMTLADTDTMMTTMVEAQKLTKRCGQKFTVFTDDQQRYIVAVMADGCLEDGFKSSFRSVSQMLTGKRFPQNGRVLRMVVEELLR